MSSSLAPLNYSIILSTARLKLQGDRGPDRLSDRTKSEVLDIISLDQDKKDRQRLTRLIELIGLKKYLKYNEGESEVQEKNLIEIARKLCLEVFSHDEYIFRQDEEGDKFYIILSGTVIGISETAGYFESGENFLLESKEVCRLYQGHSFGEMALLSGASRSLSMKAYSDVILISLKKVDFLKCFGDNISEKIIQIKDYLRTIKAFSCFKDRSLKSFASKLILKTCPTGHILIDQNEKCKNLFILKNGQIAFIRVIKKNQVDTSEFPFILKSKLRELPEEIEVEVKLKNNSGDLLLLTEAVGNLPSRYKVKSLIPSQVYFCSVFDIKKSIGLEFFRKMPNPDYFSSSDKDLLKYELEKLSWKFFKSNILKEEHHEKLMVENQETKPIKARRLPRSPFQIKTSLRGRSKSRSSLKQLSRETESPNPRSHHKNQTPSMSASNRDLLFYYKTRDYFCSKLKMLSQENEDISAHWKKIFLNRGKGVENIANVDMMDFLNTKSRIKFQDPKDATEFMGTTLVAKENEYKDHKDSKDFIPVVDSKKDSRKDKDKDKDFLLFDEPMTPRIHLNLLESTPILKKAPPTSSFNPNIRPFSPQDISNSPGRLPLRPPSKTSKASQDPQTPLSSSNNNLFQEPPSQPCFPPKSFPKPSSQFQGPISPIRLPTQSQPILSSVKRSPLKNKKGHSFIEDDHISSILKFQCKKIVGTAFDFLRKPQINEKNLKGKKEGLAEGGSTSASRKLLACKIDEFDKEAAQVLRGIQKKGSSSKLPLFAQKHSLPTQRRVHW